MACLRRNPAACSSLKMFSVSCLLKFLLMLLSGLSRVYAGDGSLTGGFCNDKSTWDWTSCQLWVW